MTFRPSRLPPTGPRFSSRRLVIPAVAVFDKPGRYARKPHLSRPAARPDLVLITEELLPGAVIPWHRHLDQDEIVYTENGTVYAQVGDRTESLGPHATIFIPRKTWVTIKNSGQTTVRLLAVFNHPDFAQFLRCISVPAGRQGHALTRTQVDTCYRSGDAENR